MDIELDPNLKVICDFDLYGFTDNNIDTVITALSQCLEVEFSQYGELYEAWGDEDDPYTELDNYNLYRNFSIEDQKWIIPQFKQYPIVLYVSVGEDSYQLEARLKQAMGDRAVLLSRRTVTLKPARPQKSL